MDATTADWISHIRPIDVKSAKIPIPILYVYSTYCATAHAIIAVTSLTELYRMNGIAKIIETLKKSLII
jgi:hypothetical protein